MAKGKKTSSSGKVRFDGLDVAAMVAQLQSTLAGKRIINIYDGVSDADAFVIKFDGKELLFLESGIRFHTTQHSLQQEGMPSPFCSKLRKHLRGLRLETISQLGLFDRVIHIVFGTGPARMSLILEFYARGNLILTNASLEILALLRSHDYQDSTVQVKVGQVYPVTYATSLGDTSEKGLVGNNEIHPLEWAKAELSKDKKADSSIPLKALLLKPSSGIHHYGPSLIEHCILCAGFDPDMKLSLSNIEEALPPSSWEKLVESLQQEGRKVMQQLSTQVGKGYILYRPKPITAESTTTVNIHPNGLAHEDKVLLEFQPHLLKQHEDQLVLSYDNFALAVDDFYAHIGGQKRSLRADAAEAAAKDKLAKIQKDQERRVETLVKEQEQQKDHAKLIEFHAKDVDKALSVINSALDTGMDWDTLEQLVETEQQNENPVAMLIKKLHLEKDSMTLSLPDPNSTLSVDVIVSLLNSAHGNASDMFAKYRAAKDKSQKTIEASTKALKAAEATAQKQLAEAQKKSKLTATMHTKRKLHWFEKFHWMITSDNYLVLGGRDAQQNEQLVKRYLRPGDAYLHADVFGAASCILRAKRRRKAGGGKTETLPLPDQALREAGSFTICRSSAWASRMVTSAWWVESHQVSKTAPSGEYLTVGSFMVRGKKNFLPPSPLEMGLAVLFRLGDDDSIARHRNERRDFSIIEDDDSDDLDVVAKEPNGGGGIAKDIPLNPIVTDDKTDADETLGPEEPRTEIATENPSPASVDDEEAENLMNETIPTSDVDSDDNDSGSKQRNTKGSDVDSDDNDSGPKQNKTKGSDVDYDDNDSGPKQNKKKGLSVKERKLIKKYGSLEMANAATVRQRPSLDKEDTLSTTSNSVNAEDVSSHSNVKRGRKSKMKRAAKKYADQDDEERELALLALHAGEKQQKKNNGKHKETQVSDSQKQAAVDASALLVKDSSKISEELPPTVREILAQCVTTKEGDQITIRWDKFDGDILEQVIALESEQQIAAANRLLFLKQSTRVDNFSASLAGIVRTIRKYGHANLETAIVPSDANAATGSKRKTKSEKEAEEEAWKDTLAEEGIVDDDADDDVVDDTVEISKLTGKPLPEDSILYAVPVCAPYQTLTQYKYRVKLTPGNQKRGKASKECVDMFLQSDGDKSLASERNRELIKQVVDNDWVQVICADVKISAPGASKAAKKQKANKKKGGKNK